MKALKAPNKSGQRGTLSPAQLSAVELIAEGHTDAEAARILKVSRQSVNTWRNHNPDFQKAVDETRREIHGKARERIEALSLKALDTIEAAVKAGSVPASLGVIRAYVSLVKPEPAPPEQTLIKVVYEGCKDKEKPYADADISTLREKYQKAIDTGDYSKLTDDELKALSNAIDPLGEIKKLSNEELIALAKGRKQR